MPSSWLLGLMDPAILLVHLTPFELVCRVDVEAFAKTALHRKAKIIWPRLPRFALAIHSASHGSSVCIFEPAVIQLLPIRCIDCVVASYCVFLMLLPPTGGVVRMATMGATVADGSELVTSD